MTLYSTRRLDRLDRWLEVTIGWQLLFGARTFADRITVEDRPYRAWQVCLGPLTIFWTRPLRLSTP